MYSVGDSAEFTKIFSEEDVLLFAGITGDRNPVHTSKQFAATTRFKKRIAHGLLTAGTISAAIGMKLPGPGCLYLSQTLEFKAPVFLGDEITARVEIVEVISPKRLRMKTQCFNQDKVLVIDGEAIIVPPRRGGKRFVPPNRRGKGERNEEDGNCGCDAVGAGVRGVRGGHDQAGGDVPVVGARGRPGQGMQAGRGTGGRRRSTRRAASSGRSSSCSPPTTRRTSRNR